METLHGRRPCRAQAVLEQFDDGGYAALMGLVKSPDVFACAVSIAGPTDLRMLLRDREFYVGVGSQDEVRIGRWWSDRERLRLTSPVDQIGSIRKPVLLLHGVQDVVVPVEHSRIMAEKFKAARYAQYRYVELPFGDHWLSREQDRIRVFSELEEFLTPYLQ
ncbi:hypothetical protein W02_29050 [Nitrospira sp. KM1]|uniref:alpha/beta hydrolase family protein n=1 Tax=Nitrospira sp. KM1 TaxID=1936990 RepID=UPI0013A75817|nr:prolyl oligopeptidase family serine peptidase [Nitrospira sp. KM1]BCA55765.1 hypothetical protein W02_29050 [Nitrospira sp. KM1]